MLQSTGCLKKCIIRLLCSFCLIFLVAKILESWNISQMKGDIHRFVLSNSSFLSDNGELRYRQNNTMYQIIEEVLSRLILYSYNLIPCVVVPVSTLPYIAQKTAYTQIKGNIHRYVLSTSRFLCDIREPRYNKIKMGYQI